ncbi:MAG TPA: phenylalanine--tRNA ligase subunit beta, partial [Bellilinea sp.]
MKVPLSWLKDYVDIDLPLIELADVLTMAGLEVEGVTLVGLPNPYDQAGAPQRREVSIEGLSWDPAKIVVAQIDEVMPHPNADRLVLCRLNDGTGELVVLTGAPNLFEFKGTGLLAQPLKVAYAREGARLYDGHQPGLVLTTLKRTKIRGVDSFSMVCSEKELGISEEHEGILILDDDAPTGMPLVDYMGDAVMEVNILPNMIRAASMVGIAREVAALTHKPLRKPAAALPANGPSMNGKAKIQITDPQLNARFVLGMLESAEQRPSPYKVQLRLRLAGMRPINAVVDATNYVMLELGQPLHAFDYDVLVQRAGGQAPTIITRAARPGETLTTLDGVERKLDDFTVLVCDTAGALSLAGVMGGQESEITSATRNILLEGATWNFINTRRTTHAQKLSSEAGYRFSRGIHPALAAEGVQLCLQRMAEWSGGVVYSSLVDEYPLPAVDPEAEITTADVRRLLGIELSAAEVAALLSRLEFSCRVDGETVYAKTPPHRLDIGSGVIGRADLAEEVARMYGYDRIPATNMAEGLPDARADRPIQVEKQVRQTLARLGLQEVINYRLTSPEREARLTAATLETAQAAYITLKNPLSPERGVMRR